MVNWTHTHTCRKDCIGDMPCAVMIADGGLESPNLPVGKSSMMHQLSAFTDSWKAEDVFQAVFVVLVGCPADQSDLRLVRVDEL